MNAPDRNRRRDRATETDQPVPAGGGYLSHDLDARPRSLASRGAAPRRVSSPGARAGILSLAVVLAFLAGCTDGTDKKLILAANELQVAAAGAYDGAKAMEDASGKACAAKAAAAGQRLAAPTRETVPQIRAACASLGAPIPFDPFALADLAGPLNASYEAIRAADAIRRGAQKGDLPRSIGSLIEAISRLWQAAADVGVTLPANTLAGGKP